MSLFPTNEVMLQLTKCDISEDAKERLRQGYVTCGAPISHAHQVVDLAIHAHDQVMAKLLEVCSSSGSEAIRVSTLALAVQLLEDTMNVMVLTIRQTVESADVGILDININDHEKAH